MAAKVRDYKKDCKFNIITGVAFLAVAGVDLYSGLKQTGSVRFLSFMLWILTAGIWFGSAIICYRRYKKGM